MSRCLRVHLAELASGERELPREAAHYLCVVHRQAVGASFIAFDPELALQAEGRILSINRHGARCVLSAPRPAPRISFGVRLLQAVPKGDRLEQVVRAATALGAESIQLVSTERSIALPGNLRRERLHTLAIEVARQCGRGDLPRIDGPDPLETALTSIAGLEGLKLCLSPGYEQPFSELVQQWVPGAPACVLIGPEGGFSDGELSAAVRAGCILVGLGPFVLRSELAATAALACFAARLPSRSDPDEGEGGI